MIFDPKNIDQDCDKIAGMMSVEADFIKEALDAGLYKQGVTMYLQLLKSMCDHFVEDEHYCYFDDMYSPEYTMLWIYKEIQKHDIDAESQALLERIMAILLTFLGSYKRKMYFCVKFEI